MSEAKPQERIVLKVLSGIQAGAEVSLPPGDYRVGSGADDDIQLVDVSLKAGHARLRVDPAKIEIMGLAGALTTTNGLSLAAGSDVWQEVEPLDIVTAGTIRFSLGSATANWTSLGEVAEESPGSRRPKRGTSLRTAPNAPSASKIAQLAIPVVLLALVGVGGWLLLSSTSDRGRAVMSEKRSDVDLIREAFNQFPFGPAIVLKQEVDGTIYASGYVESPVERRALVGAADKLGAQVRFRISVLQTMRSEIDNLIKSAKLPLTFTLDKGGELAVDGLILNGDTAGKFVDQISNEVSGIGHIDNRIRTAKTLLAEIDKLTKLSQIDNFVILRLDKEIVEANGVLPVDKIDAWVGFLQSYSRRFSNDIPLRSFVQLQNAAGTVVAQAQQDTGPAIVIGDRKSGGNDVVLDIERLKRGIYDLSDLFVGVDKRPPPATDSLAPAAAGAPGIAGAPAVAGKPGTPGTPAAGTGPLAQQAHDAAPTATVGPPTLPPTTITIIGPTQKSADDATHTPAGTLGTLGTPSLRSSAQAGQAGVTIPASGQPTNGNDPIAASLRASDTANPTNTVDPGKQRAQTLSPVPAAENREEIMSLVIRANGLIRSWLLGNGTIPAQANEVPADLGIAIDKVAILRATLDQDRRGPKKVDRATLAASYLPILPEDLSREPRPVDLCWPGSRLTATNLPAALFWLDMLSVSSALSIDYFSREEQAFVIEAALNPTTARTCLQRANGQAAAKHSLYLAEASRNPDFVRFIMRTLKPAQLDISGANLSGQRYVQTRDGYKMHEGFSPDGGSRIAVVGELGVALRVEDGFSTLIYGRDLNWMLSQPD